MIFDCYTVIVLEFSLLKLSFADGINIFFFKAENPSTVRLKILRLSMLRMIYTGTEWGKQFSSIL